MSKKLEDRISEYVGGLEDSEVRDELEKAYLHMYRCTEALRGKEAEPVLLNDDECIGEELFYLCKKKGLEAGYGYTLDEFIDGFGGTGAAITSEIRKAKFLPGQTVYYWNGAVCHSVIDEVSYDDEDGWEVMLENGTVLKGFKGIFRSKKELIKSLKSFAYGKE